tara:strand:+ start:846 stop:1793 length:948 start_codon:yes stop_codon:yes gene_type:complete
MKRTICIAAFFVALFATAANAQDNALYQHLQDVSVTVKAAGGEGSGIIVTREVEVSPNVKQKVNFVWTAAHVVDGLRSVRVVIKNGKPTTVVEFKDAQIVKELVEDGRRVGEFKMEAKVIKYSDAENGEDLALLMVRKKGFIDKTTTFYKDSGKPVAIGTELYHVGSLLGQVGSNSMTRGICSQVGRVLDLGTGDGVVFDQTTVTAFPGSSGGGVFLSERSKEKAGQYVGMLVRGAGETFNLIVPVRRMRSYAKKEGVLWAIDTDVKIPSIADITSLSAEGPKVKTTPGLKTTKDSVKFPVLPLRSGEKNEIKRK